MPGPVRKRLIVIMGPTAVGKTKVALQLAKLFKTEIISADSRQLFKEITIGTAKPSDEELSQVPHHFINHKSVAENYDAGQYGRDALKLIQQLFEHLDNVIVCGGSGLYIKAILQGFDEMPDVPDGIRQQLIQEYQLRGLGWLQAQVEENDPDYFTEMDRQNPQRLMRALEIIRATGKPASEFRKNKKMEHTFDVAKIGLELDREDLYVRINNRVEAMMEEGLLEEAKGLHSKKTINALQTVGYQELFGYFDGDYDIEEAVNLLKRNTRRYAKRQLTWFKKDNEIKWFRPDEVEQIIRYLGGE